MIRKDEKPTTEAKRPASALMDKFSTILRRLGIIVLLAAAVSFLVQGWAGWDTLCRFYSFLGFSAFLAAIGLLVKILLRDERGSLALVGLATAFITVHFSELGALLYSLVGSPPKNFPEVFILIAPSSSSVYEAGLIALLFAVPTAYLGFRYLIGRESLAATTVFIFGNLTLLIPTRKPEYILIIGAVLFAIVLAQDLINFVIKVEAKKPEVSSARFLLFVPFLLLLGRACSYGYSNFIMSLVFGCIGGFMFCHASVGKKGNEVASFVRFLSLLPLALSWRHLMVGLLASVQTGFLYDYRFSFIYLPISGIALLLSLHAGSQTRNFVKISAVIAAMTVLIQLFALYTLGAALLCVIVSVFVLCLAFTFEEIVVFYLGSLTLGFGLVYHIHYAAKFFRASPWVSLSLLGLMLIISSSLLTRYYEAIMLRILGFRNELHSWK